MKGTSLAVAAFLLAGASASAQEGVAFRGFVSQGYLKSSDHRFLSADTDRGTFAFTEAALNVTAQPLPKLRVAAQIFARDFGAQGDNRFVLDWGLGEYRAWDQLGLRIGRVKFPVGLYNTLADADMTRPEIFQPGGVYPPERRDLTNAIDGAGLFGTIELGRAGYVEYEALWGTIDLDESYLLSRAGDSVSRSLIPALTALRFSGVNYTVGELSGRADKAWGGFVEWHPPVSGLRLRGGAQGARVDFSVLTTYTAFAGPAPVALAIRSSLRSEVPSQVVASAEYSRGGLRLSAEHLRGTFETTTALTGTPFPAPPPTVAVNYPSATYGQVAYRFNERLQASGYYSVSYVNRKDKDGRSLVQRGEPAHNAWLKDLAFTLRVDVRQNWLVKAEVHRFDGTSNLTAAENPDPLEPEWTLFAVKTTFHF
jgi:hypothetical protein